MAPIFITVVGGNDCEVPKNQLMSLQVPGMCVGGRGVTIRKQKFDILIFMCADKGMDKHK